MQFFLHLFGTQVSAVIEGHDRFLIKITEQLGLIRITAIINQVCRPPIVKANIYLPRRKSFGVVPTIAREFGPMIATAAVAFLKLDVSLYH
jgi:hypothetical protein